MLHIIEVTGTGPVMMALGQHQRRTSLNLFAHKVVHPYRAFGPGFRRGGVLRSLGRQQELIMRHWRGPFDRQGYHHGNLKEALIEAAQRFIAERGIGGFTLADAAKLVGVTPAALYRHFRGRDALVAEVAFRGYDELAKRLGRALQSDGTALERFTRMGEAYLAFAEQEPGFYAAMFSAKPAESETCGPFGSKGAQGDEKTS